MAKCTHRLVLRSLGMVAALALGGTGTGVSATQFDAILGNSTKDWVERAPDFPEPPASGASLQHLSAIARGEFDYSIDTKSLTVGDDGVVRYAIVAVSRSGARNVRYEGVRCATAEGKLYAVESGSGAWEKARGASWQVLSDSGARSAQFNLARDYLCDNVAGAPLELKVIWARLKAPATTTTANPYNN